VSTSIVELETETVDCEVSDEALEVAASAGQGNPYYTLGACTGLSVCPE
jgi:hypothetical protein